MTNASNAGAMAGDSAVVDSGAGTPGDGSMVISMRTLAAWVLPGASALV